VSNAAPTAYEDLVSSLRVAWFVWLELSVTWFLSYPDGISFIQFVLALSPARTFASTAYGGSVILMPGTPSRIVPPFTRRLGPFDDLLPLYSPDGLDTGFVLKLATPQPPAKSAGRRNRSDFIANASVAPTTVDLAGSPSSNAPLFRTLSVQTLVRQTRQHRFRDTSPSTLAMQQLPRSELVALIERTAHLVDVLNCELLSVLERRQAVFERLGEQYNEAATLSSFLARHYHPRHARTEHFGAVPFYTVLLTPPQQSKVCWD
jgi:hypothetical protein